MSFLHAREVDLRAGPPQWTLPPDQFERSVQAAINDLPRELRDTLEGALVIVGDVPGAEVVADGVDPRHGVLFDALEGTPPRPTRVFIYQRNIERLAGGILAVQTEITGALEHELQALHGPPPGG